MTTSRFEGRRVEVIECYVYATRFDGVRLYGIAKAWLIDIDAGNFVAVPFNLDQVKWATPRVGEPITSARDRDETIRLFREWAQATYEANWESVATRAVRILKEATLSNNRSF